MKTRKIIVEIVCFILMMNFFYDGIYKVAYWQNFGVWMYYAPLLDPVSGVLKYSIPIGEIILAISFFLPRFRKWALYVSIGTLLIFVFWIMTVSLFTHRLFWPFHALWAKPNWVEKMLFALAFCWLSFVALILQRPLGSRQSDSKFLRNMPADAS
ncbi:hypothetical protein Q4E93_08955 [Flavitalea sp. BT771]|uniref:MauE/DoxX family redox-associated membrane protein n=1 Tax=Flavitalea sp. BT771 TaxID=3063329 RepID=UPI0026E20B2D|nr:MauE/DoxX family redox-associated membrane protein [Flavitalea sp. BT771]MDO6430715.1 hypothetical protein [Flavitalea sp. BT771]MDV6219145.1 hypothetical protein [Flavitalea sp. BT771]